METKSVVFEVKDFSKQSRTAVIAHAVYGNIDRVGDISTKGMFSSSWARQDEVSFYFNHNPELVPGKVVRTFEDEQKAYTEVKFGNWQLGNDVMEMVEFGVIKGASFGYETEKKDFIDKAGKKVRVLRQVKHFETSLLTVPPANPLAGVVSLTKQESKLNELKAALERMEHFCNNSSASDETILKMRDEIKQAKKYLSSDDTVSTPLITDGGTSMGELKDFATQLHLLTLKL